MWAQRNRTIPCLLSGQFNRAFHEHLPSLRQFVVQVLENVSMC